MTWLGSTFIWKKEATILIFYIKKNKRSKWKKIKKMFLLYFKVDAKCLNIDIWSVSINGRVAKILQNFPRIPSVCF